MAENLDDTGNFDITGIVENNENNNNDFNDIHENDKSVDGLSRIEDNQEMMADNTEINYNNLDNSVNPEDNENNNLDNSINPNNEEKNNNIDQNTNTEDTQNKNNEDENKGNKASSSKLKDLKLDDLENNTLEEIAKYFDLPLTSIGDVVPTFTKVLVQNTMFKFYMAKNTHIGVCSLMVLNGITFKKKEFIKILQMFKNISEIDCNYLLKLKGITIIDENTCYLLFDPLMNCYYRKIIEGTKFTDHEKFALLFYIVEMTSKLHEKQLSFEEFSLDNIIYNAYDEFKYLIPMKEFTGFNKTHDNKNDTFKPYDKPQFNRYLTPEQVVEEKRIIISDIWIIGCIFIELFSEKTIWYGYKENQMLEELKKYYVPKIFSDVPHQTWGLICECLNPFSESRIDSKELLERFVKLLVKMKITIIEQELKKYTVTSSEESSTKVIDNIDPKLMRKCPLHPKLDACLFCAQCCEVICENCKSSIHSDHSEKGLTFDYIDFVNLARNRVHVYKEKFLKYLNDANVPIKEQYNSYMEQNRDGILKLFENQKIKIEEQFTYLYKILEELKEIEIEHLTNFKEYFFILYSKIFDNYVGLNDEIDSVNSLIENKEKNLLQFQDMDQLQKEETLKSVPKDENILNIKKKNIIKYVSSFHKESSQIEKIKRYFEVFIDKYKENKINELVKVVEKKKVTVKNRYTDVDKDSYLKILIYEFEQMALLTSRNYFSTNARELFISIVNTNKIFSYNLDSNKYFITEIDFKEMPVDKFPNYSRSLIINGNLLVNGGYDDTHKVTLPYFLYYDRLNKTITRLSDMLFGHSAHSIIFVPPNNVVVVSGSGTLKCEKYSLEENKWSELPDITVCRQNCTLYYYNKQYLYAFGGAYWDDSIKGFVYIESVERLDLGYGSVEGAEKWEPIQTYKYGEGTSLKKSVMAVISFSPNKIYLVGGSISYNTYTDEIIQFDFEKNEFSLKEGLALPQKTCFPNKSFMFFGDKCYQLDNDGNVFEFDVVKEKFRIIKENTSIKKK